MMVTDVVAATGLSGSRLDTFGWSGHESAEGKRDDRPNFNDDPGVFRSPVIRRAFDAGPGAVREDAAP